MTFSLFDDKKSIDDIILLEHSKQIYRQCFVHKHYVTM